jgi:hypothetical protein
VNVHRNRREQRSAQHAYGWERNWIPLHRTDPVIHITRPLGTIDAYVTGDSTCSFPRRAALVRPSVLPPVDAPPPVPRDIPAQQPPAGSPCAACRPAPLLVGLGAAAAGATRSLLLVPVHPSTTHFRRDSVRRRSSLARAHARTHARHSGRGRPKPRLPLGRSRLAAAG